MAMTVKDVIEIASEAATKATIAYLQSEAGDALREVMQKLAADSAKAGAEAAKKAALAVQEEEMRQQRDSRLHNTKLLMKNYRRLKTHFESAVYEFDAETDENADGMIWRIMSDHYGNDQQFIDSIWRSAARTMIMIQHVDKMLDMYRVMCARASSDAAARRYRVLYARYIADEESTMADIADREAINKRTAEKDLNAAISDISYLLFGVDGMKSGLMAV